VACVFLRICRVSACRVHFNVVVSVQRRIIAYLHICLMKLHDCTPLTI